MNETNNSNQTFQYSYSAADRKEIEDIRNKYQVKEKGTLEQLRSLDRNVTRKSVIISCVVGIIGTLIFGTGMSFCLVWSENLFYWGVVCGLLGLVVIALAYPVYLRILKNERERLRETVLQMTEELLK